MLKTVLRCLMLALVLAPMSNEGQKSGVEQLEWLAGCRVSDDGNTRIEEVWMKPAGLSITRFGASVFAPFCVFAPICVFARNSDYSK